MKTLTKITTKTSTTAREGSSAMDTGTRANANHDTWNRRRREGEVYQATRRAIELAQVIYDARMARNMSQTAVAKAAGIRQATVSAIEAADHLPNWETLDRIAAVLGLELNVTLTVR